MANLRASETTHAQLKWLSIATGEPIQTVLDHAVEAYRRTVFLQKLNEEYAALHDDADSKADENEERLLWEQTLADG
ncbi:MAG TPA: hypothetical protein VGL56_06865 [Fimbriimonadaceae bacterium]|jgi:hypothetical protein